MWSDDSIKLQQPLFLKNTLNYSFRKGGKMVLFLVSDENTLSDHFFTVRLVYFYFNMRTNAKRLDKAMNLSEPVFKEASKCPLASPNGRAWAQHIHNTLIKMGWHNVTHCRGAPYPEVLKYNIFQFTYRHHLLNIMFIFRTQGLANGTGWNGLFAYH